MRRLGMTAAVLAATLVAVALPTAASADPEWSGGGWHDDEQREEWHEAEQARREAYRQHEAREEWQENNPGYAYGGYGAYGGYNGYAGYGTTYVRPYAYARPYRYSRPPVVYYYRQYRY